MTRKAERDNKGEGERKKKKEQGATRGSPVVASIPWTSSSCTTMCPRAQEGQAAWGGGGKTAARRNRCFTSRLRNSQIEIQKVLEPEAPGK